MRGVIIAVVIVLVSALALFASINTVTIFTGSHYMTDISSPQNDIDCTWCHSWMADELNHSAIHSSFKCEECHRMKITTSGEAIEYATHNASGIYPGNQTHAAYTPTCLDCHGGSGIYYNDTWKAKQAPPAPAFNQSDYGSDYSAHKGLVEDAKKQGMSFGENEACIACHTNYSLQLDYSYFWNINYSVDNWTISSFSFNGTRDYSANHQDTGAKHEFVKSSDINCITCHKNIYDALVNGTDGGTNEDYLTHSPIEINSNDTDTKSEWDADNAWGNYRYHYIDSNRAERVDNSYCFKCHNVKKYADNHSSDKSTYSLGNVTSDTNSPNVHAAEALWCQTCHGSGKTKEVINNTDYSKGAGHTDQGFVDEVKNNYARTFHGDICMGCHEAAVHPEKECSKCHKDNKEGANIYIESEPSGNATTDAGMDGGGM